MTTDSCFGEYTPTMQFSMQALKITYSTECQLCFLAWQQLPFEVVDSDRFGNLIIEYCIPTAIQKWKKNLWDNLINAKATVIGKSKQEFDITTSSKNAEIWKIVVCLIVHFGAMPMHCTSLTWNRRWKIQYTLLLLRIFTFGSNFPTDALTQRLFWLVGHRNYL